MRLQVDWIYNKLLVTGMCGVHSLTPHRIPFHIYETYNFRAICVLLLGIWKIHPTKALLQMNEIFNY